MHIFHTITHIFITYLFPVSNLALVKPEKANAVENYLIQMARFGKLGGKVRQKEQNTVCFLSSPWQNYEQTFLFSDFWVRLNRDSRKSQSANGEKDHSYSKSPWNVLKPSIQFLSISPHTALCAWLAVQQTEGDGLRRRGWLLSLDKSAGMRQKKKSRRWNALLGFCEDLWLVRSHQIPGMPHYLLCPWNGDNKTEEQRC